MVARLVRVEEGEAAQVQTLAAVGLGEEDLVGEAVPQILEVA